MVPFSLEHSICGAMPFWLSPFPIPSPIEQGLLELGWNAWKGDPDQLPVDGAWLYGTPDQSLALMQQGPAAMLNGYRHLLAFPVGTRLVAIHRLLPELPVDPLAQALTQLFLTHQAGLLDAYLDLELRSDLLGDQPDTAYARQLLGEFNPEAAFAAWQGLQGLSPQAEAELTDLRDREREAREEAELTLLQLHQVQEELEQVFLADREKQQKLTQLEGAVQASESLRGELDTAREELDAARAELTALHDREREAREEAELTLLQLHQVQEELEHYFLLSRAQNQQLSRYGELQRRSHRLLAQVARHRMALVG